MRNSYEDIRALTEREPVWWDEHGVPRYERFRPDLCPDIYANEAVLYRVTCQNCGKAWDVAETRGPLDMVLDIAKSPHIWSLRQLIEAKQLDYGDPPNTGCCGAGPSMNSEPRCVIEYWSRHHTEYTAPLGDDSGIMEVTDIGAYMTWRRDPVMEVDITPDWVTHL